MLEYIDMVAVDPDYDWVEVEAKDELNEQSCLVHLVIQDAHDMAYTFVQRYQAKQSISFNFSDSLVSALREFFQEARLAQVMFIGQKPLDDLAVMLRTQTLCFAAPERSTLRKSKLARVRLYVDEAFQLMQKHLFDQALKRITWIHLLDPKNAMAFELRIACLRSAKQISDCVSAFEGWIKAYPDQIEPYLGLGEVWLYLDQDAKAKEVFTYLLKLDPKNSMALLGLAQAKARLGEEYMMELSKSFLVDSAYTKEVVEHIFDFRAKHPGRLSAKTLVEVAEHYGIPLKRLMGRAQRGVLPFHRQDGKGLLHFSETELERYYQSLRQLGLEIRSQPLPVVKDKQLDLFESDT